MKNEIKIKKIILLLTDYKFVTDMRCLSLKSVQGVTKYSRKHKYVTF